MKKIVLLFWVFSFSLLSQVQNPEWRNYTHSGWVLSIAKEGNFIWLGTLGGLVRMNKSTQQKVFFNKGNSCLPSNQVYSIAIDTSGYKWLGTGNGLAKFKDDTWTIFRTNNSGLPGNQLRSVVIDNAGNKWIGTKESGLAMYDGSVWTVFNQQNSSLGSNAIRALKVDNNVLWVGTIDGLYEKVHNDFIFINAAGTGGIKCLDKDVHGNTWVGTYYNLLRLTGTDSITVFSFYNINCLFIDNHNVKWFGMSDEFNSLSGMRNIDSADTQVTINSLVNSATDYPWFHSILVEPSGAGWFGSENGLVTADGDAEFITVSNSLLGQILVPKMFIDHNNRKWFYAWGSIPLSGFVLPPGYLVSLVDSSWTDYNLTNSPVDIGGVAAVSDYYGNDMFVAVYNIWGDTDLYHYLSSSGTWEPVNEPQTQYDFIRYMWFDQTTGLLWVDYEGANFQSNLFTTPDGSYWTPVTEYPVYDISQMKRLNDIIWMASPHGLVKYDGINYTLYNTSNSGLPDNVLSSLDFDSQGTVWVGSRLGLAGFDGTNWTVYDRNNSPLTADNISSLVIDQDDNIYLGNSLTYPPSSLGLIRFDGTNWTIFNNNNSGKPDYAYGYEDINSLNIDAGGNIWLATGGGVGVYDEDGVPVPVELISFNTDAADCDVHLTWSTSTETNNRGFEIERSVSGSSGREWKTIAFIEGSGTTTETMSYSYIDKNLLPGNYVYRLKQIDLNGRITYSRDVEVSVGTPRQFSLSQNYPNPFNPATSIEYSVPAKSMVTLKVFDVLGNLISVIVNEEKTAGTYELTWNAANLTSGVYFYQIKAGNFIQTKKMILLK